MNEDTLINIMTRITALELQVSAMSTVAEMPKFDKNEYYEWFNVRSITTENRYVEYREIAQWGFNHALKQLGLLK